MTQKQFVIPDWMSKLTFQQQSVLMLALRGPDGVRKHHPMKNIQRAYRGTILKAAVYGRLLAPGEEADSFMSMERIVDVTMWQEDMLMYFHHIDELPHHFHAHLMHGAQILGYKHESFVLRQRWNEFYFRCVDDAHLKIETEAEMDERLNDWGKIHWDVPDLDDTPEKSEPVKPTVVPPHEKFWPTPEPGEAHNTGESE